MNVFRRLRRALSNLSFRAKLIIANAILAGVVILGITYYTLSRAAITGDRLSEQLTSSVRTRAESQLNGIAGLYSGDLDDFFGSMSISMETVRDTLKVVLSNDGAAAPAGPVTLTRLPQGSWDNANSDPGSIFISSREEISPEILAEIGLAKQIDLIAPGILERNANSLAVYFGSALGETLYYPNIDLAGVLPEDFDVTQRPWYAAASPTANPGRHIVWSRPYQDAALNGLVITCSAPVYDGGDRFRGVAAIDIQLTQIDALVSSIRVGQTGYAFLIDGEGHIISMPENGFADFGISDPDAFRADPFGFSVLKTASVDVFGVVAKMTSGQSGLQTATINGVEKYFAFRPVSTVGYSLGIVVPTREMQGEVADTKTRLFNERQDTIRNILLGIGVVFGLFLLASLWLGNALTAPLERLTDTARGIAEGNLSARSEIDSQDEIGAMARTINGMAQNLLGLIENLETRVAERTADLVLVNDSSERRARQLKIVSEVTRTISTESNVEKLLALITSAISEQFGVYHVGVYLVDNTAAFATLQASNSSGGKRLLARRYRAEEDGQGLVSRVLSSGSPQVATNLSTPPDPDLAETHSEMALPLILRSQLFGILDIHSADPSAFQTEDVEIFGILADQIAVAIENAQLFGESQDSLNEIQSLYGEYIGRVWERKTGSSPLGYYLTQNGGRALTRKAEWDEIQFAQLNGNRPDGSGAGEDPAVQVGASLSIPIRLHKQVIGTLNVRSAHPTRQWKQDEIAIVEATADRLALALENARLFEETSGRAAREHTVAEITAKIRQTNDPQAMIRTAIEELQNALGAQRVEIVPQVASAFLSGREVAGDTPDKEQE